jgi:hypothetical protein
MVGRELEVYIDDIVSMAQSEEQHLQNLRKAFERMRQYKFPIHPLKCAFGVSAGNFLGFLVHQKGIEIDENKAKESNHPGLTPEKQKRIAKADWED